MTVTRYEQDVHRRLRIGIVAHSELGGSGTVATELAVGLAAVGHEVHVITPRRPFRLGASCEVTVHEVEAPEHPMWESPPVTLALASRVAEVAADVRLDLLHAHFAVPYAAATELACQILGPVAPPWVATLHGSDVDPLGTSRAYGPVVRHALRRASRVTVVSEDLRRRVEAELGLARPVEVIGNFVDGDRFVPGDRTPPSAEVVLVHASNFRPVKRVDDVVEVFARVAAARPARLLLLGEGPELEPALAALGARGLADRVEAVGPQREVERFLRRAHVALLPSEQESFGLAALEALAAGVPVVGTRVGGLPEVVTHGHTGHLAAVGDVEGMAAAILQLVADDARWATMASAASADARARFSVGTALRAYDALYREALSIDEAPPIHTPRILP